MATPQTEVTVMDLQSVLSGIRTRDRVLQELCFTYTATSAVGNLVANVVIYGEITTHRNFMFK